jgi:hypothetical protein
VPSFESKVDSSSDEKTHSKPQGPLKTLSKEDQEAQDYVDKLDQLGPLSYKSPFAKTIHDLALSLFQNSASDNSGFKAAPPERVTSFEPGRLAFSWDTGNSKGRKLEETPDLPETIIRSRAEVQTTRVFSLLWFGA